MGRKHKSDGPAVDAEGTVIIADAGTNGEAAPPAADTPKKVRRPMVYRVVGINRVTNQQAIFCERPTIGKLRKWCRDNNLILLQLAENVAVEKTVLLTLEQIGV